MENSTTPNLHVNFTNHHWRKCLERSETFGGRGAVCNFIIRVYFFRRKLVFLASFHRRFSYAAV